MELNPLTGLLTDVSPFTFALLGYTTIAVASFALVRVTAARLSCQDSNDVETAYRLRQLRHRGYLYGWLATVSVTVLLDMQTVIVRILVQLAAIQSKTATVLASVLMFVAPVIPVVLAVRLGTLPYRRLARQLNLKSHEIVSWVLSRSFAGVVMMLVGSGLIATVPRGWLRLTLTAILALIFAATMPLVLVWGMRARPLTSDEREVIESALTGTEVVVRISDDRTRIGSALAAGIVPGHRYVFVAESLFDILSDDECTAVVTHEICHHERQHVLLQLTAFSAPFFVWLALLEFGIPNAIVIGAAITVPSLLGVGALVRWTEHDADACVAEQGAGETLASALEQLLEQHYIMTQTGLLASVLAIHPPISKRIEILKKHQTTGGQAE